MRKLIDKLNIIRRWIRGYISPVFIGLFCASFILWYILKLGNVYTTNYDVRLNLDGNALSVSCVVEGKGTTLLGYGVYSSSNAKMLRSEIKHTIIEEKVLPEGETDSILVSRKMHITPAAMQDALSVRFSDLKFVSVGNIPEIELPKK